MLRSAPWTWKIRQGLQRALCVAFGHRPVVVEAEARERDSTPRWRFRCGDCGTRYWWP